MNPKISITVLVMLLGWGVEQSMKPAMAAHLQGLPQPMSQFQDHAGHLPDGSIAFSGQESSGQGVPEGRRGGGTR